MNELMPSRFRMNSTHWSDNDFGTEQWRRRVLFEHIQFKIREQQRLRFLGQCFAIAALIAIGAIALWAAQSLGLTVDVTRSEFRTGTVIVTFVLAIGLLILAVVLWGARTKLHRSELELLKRDFDSDSPDK